MTISVSGSVITFSDSTTQSTAAVAGVTSVNGATGAVVTTSVNSIGSMGYFAYASTTAPIITGGTVSGSSLWYMTGYNSYSSNQVYIEGTSSTNPNSSPVSYVTGNETYSVRRNTPGNSGSVKPASNIAVPSGTWRLMSGYVWGWYSVYNTGCGDNFTRTDSTSGLFVRIS